MNHCAILDFQTTSGNFTIKLGGSIECDGIYHHITNHLAIDACTGSLDVALDGCVVKIDIGSGNITLDNTTVTNRDVARRMNRSLKDTLDNDIGRAIQRTADIDFLCKESLTLFGGPLYRSLDSVHWLRSVLRLQRVVSRLVEVNDIHNRLFLLT